MKTPVLFTCTFLLAATVCFGAPSASTDTTDAAKAAKREKQFSKLDLNTDKVVDRDEFSKARFVQKRPERAEKRFTRMDKDSNGKLTKEEWLAAPRRKSKEAAETKA